MGGMESGRRWYWGAKNSTGDYRSIDMRSWKRNGGLAPHQSFLVFFHPCQLHNRLRCIPIPCYECVPCETNPYRAGLHPCACSH